MVMVSPLTLTQLYVYVDIWRVVLANVDNTDCAWNTYFSQLWIRPNLSPFAGIVSEYPIDGVC